MKEILRILARQNIYLKSADLSMNNSDGDCQMEVEFSKN